MQEVRIVSVPFVNARPLTWGFSGAPYRDFFRLRYAPPARIADLLRSGQADVGLIPSIEFQALPGVDLLPQIGISSKRRVRSVFLASRVPIERIRSVALDQNSRTSVALLKILLWQRGVRDAAWRPAAPSLKEMLRDHDAALVIGDAALGADTSGLFVHDLAAEWFAMTGLPFVFALWAVRAGAVIPDGVRPFLESRRIGLANIPAIALQAGQDLGLPADSIVSYLRTNIHFYLGSEERRGLELFYRMALERGIVADRRPVGFRDALAWDVPAAPTPPGTLEDRR